MSSRETYAPGPAAGAEVRKDGEKWTLILVREFRHPPAKVWQALTEPAQLREWAPFDADRNLGDVGPVKLATVGAQPPQVSETSVKRAEASRLLEYSWGGNDIRWELELLCSGTRLTLWHKIDRGFVSMGAAGWHICFDVLDRFLAGKPIGRIVAGEAMKFGWQRLRQAVRYPGPKLATKGSTVLTASELLTAASTVNGEHFLCFAHASQRVPTHRGQLLLHALHGLYERLGKQNWLPQRSKRTVRGDISPSSDSPHFTFV
jgi:Activator of Hsp90 ATPase homolog 1-like protein